MCSWGKQGEIQTKRAVILPVPRASLLGEKSCYLTVCFSGSSCTWRHAKPHTFTWVRAKGDGTKSFWMWRRWRKHIQPSNPFTKITFAHLRIFRNPLHTEVSITVLLSNCYKSLQWLFYIQLSPTAIQEWHVPFCMSLFVTTPGHSVESLMSSADKKALDYKSYPNI